jgi:hypothetical protein
MEIKTIKKISERYINSIKNLLNSRLKISKYVRSTAISLILVSLLISAFSANAAFLEPNETRENVEKYSYTQTGRFNYKVNLKNNTIYNGAEFLEPGKKIYFRKIINSINGSFYYKIKVEAAARLSGSYKISGILKTNLWEKTFTIILDKQFSTKNRSFETTEIFTIDFRYFDYMKNKIDKEIGITSSEPKLIIQFQSNIKIITLNDNIKESFYQNMSVNLKTKTFEFSNILSKQKNGAKNTIVTVQHNDIIQNRNIWTSSSLVFLVLLFLILILTKSKDSYTNSIDRKAKKISKKFNDYIVDVNKQPKRSVNFDILHTNTFADLIKISEELGKPVIHFKTENGLHTYHVIDNLHQYKYILLK